MAATVGLLGSWRTPALREKAHRSRHGRPWDVVFPHDTLPAGQRRPEGFLDRLTLRPGCKPGHAAKGSSVHGDAQAQLAQCGSAP